MGNRSALEFPDFVPELRLVDPARSWRSTYFMSACDTCGRRIQVDVKLLGDLIECPHCGGYFHAVDGGAAKTAECDSLLVRANQLLRLLDPGAR